MFARNFMMAACCLIVGAAFSIPVPALAAGKAVAYKDGGTVLEGYWAEAANCAEGEAAPVVMIVHQWKGLGAYEKNRADMLALNCYHAFAIDMYGQGIRPQTRAEAGKQASLYKSDPALSRRRLMAALDYARERAGTSGPGVAIMGYCFGGTMALELARAGADIKGAISFHGGLSTPAPATAPVKPSIQIHHGAADPNVPPAEVDAFITEMDAADADWMLIHYADAVHSFTERAAGDDPSTGSAYNEKADKRSWSATLAFLEEIFAR